MVYEPRSLAGGRRGINIAAFEPKCPSPAAPQAPPGIKSANPEPVALSDIAIWHKISIFNPKLPFCTPLQGPSGIKTSHSEPAALPGVACSGCRSGAGEVYTGAPPQTPAPLKPFPTLLRKVTGRGGPLMRTASARFKRSNMQASRCRSSPSAPLVPPQGPAEPSLAARTSISYYSPTRSQYRPRFQSGTTIKKKEPPKDDSPNRRRSAAHQGAQFIQQLH